MPAHFLIFQNFQSIQKVPQVQLTCFLFGKWYFFTLKDITKLQSFIQEHNEEDWQSLSFEEILKGGEAIKTLRRRTSRMSELCSLLMLRPMLTCMSQR
ncbi:hypothetical protein TIFTF001_041188 [Ficus carica]|uniref:Uncharacterized protein n=1 Tax=Ficus carica TaxID=3494 RepID=A0AA87ZKC0_FICCA|nr:hypothetical protein TIFTF001_041188 [Ficus carica]